MASSDLPNCAGLPRDVQIQEDFKENLTVQCELAFVHRCFSLDPCFCCWPSLPLISGLACPDALIPSQSWDISCVLTEQGLQSLVSLFHLSVYLSLPCLCMYVYMYTCSFVGTHVYAGTHACVCTCLWRSEVNTGYPSSNAVRPN